MSDEMRTGVGDALFKIKHVYGGAAIGKDVKPGDLVVLPSTEESAGLVDPPRQWFETETDNVWYIPPVFWVYSVDRRGVQLAGTCHSLMDAFDFGRALLERVDQVKVYCHEWEVILDRRGDRLPVVRYEWNEVVVDKRPGTFGRVEFWGGEG